MGRLIRTLLVLAILIIGGAYFLGYLPNTQAVLSSPPKVDAGTVAATAEDVKARAVDAAARMDSGLADTALTTKIKAKITLDDSLNGSNISVHTKDGIVTVSGTVFTPAMQERALQLARETSGVKSVTNELKLTARP